MRSLAVVALSLVVVLLVIRNDIGRPAQYGQPIGERYVNPKERPARNAPEARQSEPIMGTDTDDGSN